MTDTLWGIQTTHTVQDVKAALDSSGFGSRLVAGYGYDDVKTLAEAIEVAKSHLREDGKAEFVPLLTEERVRAAILAAIASYDAKVDDLDRKFPGANIRANWDATKPIFANIAQTGEWPADTSFRANYGLTDNLATYDGLMLDLIVKSPNGAPGGLRIIDLYYGRYE